MIDLLTAFILNVTGLTLLIVVVLLALAEGRFEVVPMGNEDS